MMRRFLHIFTFMFFTLTIVSCADVPGRGDISIPDAKNPNEKFTNVNHERDAVIFVELGEDILKPKRRYVSKLPEEVVGPFELRNETLAAALQFVLNDFDIPIAIESNDALTRTVTISKLKGTLERVIARLCGLADLYCTYEDEILTIKSEETFAVSMPPLSEEAIEGFISGLDSITGTSAIYDTATQTIIYMATHRTQRRAEDYFDRLRKNTALIIFETQIWEVNLTNTNDTGIDWSTFTLELGTFDFNFTRDGTTAISGAPGATFQYVSDQLSFDAVVQFLETQGAVKTISQPQITVLSGSEASLRIGNSRTYISEVTSTEGFDEADDISVETDVIETGLNINIQSSWAESTVYGVLSIQLQDLIVLDERSVGATTIQLPETSERNIETSIRMRPGDGLIIAGIVEERDEYDIEGPTGLSKYFQTKRDTQADNSELVFMMRPRIVVFTDENIIGRDKSVSPGSYKMSQEELLRAPPSRYTSDNIFVPQPISDREADLIKHPQPKQKQDIEERVPQKSLSDYIDNVVDDVFQRPTGQ